MKVHAQFGTGFKLMIWVLTLLGFGRAAINRDLKQQQLKQGRVLLAFHVKFWRKEEGGQGGGFTSQT